MEMTRKKVTKKTVEKILSIFNECYQGKMHTTDFTEKIWTRMLRDLDEEPVLAASFHLCSQPAEWPPGPGEVRRVSIAMFHGETAPPTGLEAWESVLRRLRNDDHVLTDMENAALKQIGNIYDLKRSPNLVADRANFVKAFESLVAKRDLDRATLPEVKQFVENNVPLLPMPEEKAQLPERPSPDEPKEMVGPEVISKFLRKITGNDIPLREGGLYREKSSQRWDKINNNLERDFDKFRSAAKKFPNINPVSFTDLDPQEAEKPTTTKKEVTK